MKIAGIHLYLRTIINFRKNKLEGNVERDKKNYSQLESMWIKIIAVWRYEIKQIMKGEVIEIERVDNLVYEIINRWLCSVLFYIIDI